MNQLITEPQVGQALENELYGEWRQILVLSPMCWALPCIFVGAILPLLFGEIVLGGIRLPPPLFVHIIIFAHCHTLMHFSVWC